MVKASLMDFNPTTGKKLDTLNMAAQLEQEVRKAFEKNNISIHIIGFTKMVGDVAEGAKGVVVFFAIAIGITAVMVFFFCHSISLTLLPIETFDVLTVFGKWECYLRLVLALTRCQF